MGFMQLNVAIGSVDLPVDCCLGTSRARGQHVDSKAE